MLTSTFEKRSLSANSATPSVRLLASAKAAPTVRTPSTLTKHSASTMGDSVMSDDEKSRSSTCCKLPGEACEAVREVSAACMRGSTSAMTPYATHIARCAAPHMHCQLSLQTHLLRQRPIIAPLATATPNLHLELPSRKRVCQKVARSHSAQRNARQACLTRACAQILDYAVRLEHGRGYEECSGTMRRVEVLRWEKRGVSALMEQAEGGSETHCSIEEAHGSVGYGRHGLEELDKVGLTSLVCERQVRRVRRIHAGE